MFQEVGDGIFRRRYASLDLNIGVVIGGDGALVVDTRASHVEADELQAEIRSITALPVIAVVNTHFHWDHVWGNSRFANVPIWGHIRCREVLERAGEEMRQRVLAAVPEERRAEVEEVEIVPPTETIEDPVGIDLGGRVVGLSHHGRGHTDSDTVVSVADEAVVFVGDLVEEGAPPAFGDSFPLDWPETLRRVETMLGGTVVPGHGDVVDRSFVETQRQELEEVASAVGKHDPSATEPPPGPYPTEVMASVWGRFQSLTS